jgi:hypothetical protein
MFITEEGDEHEKNDSEKNKSFVTMALGLPARPCFSGARKPVSV